MKKFVLALVFAAFATSAMAHGHHKVVDPLYFQFQDHFANSY